MLGVLFQNTEQTATIGVGKPIISCLNDLACHIATIPYAGASRQARLAILALIAHTGKMQPTILDIEAITERLESFQANPNMVTKSIYSPAATDYPDNQLPFVQVHLGYLKKHKQVNASQYLSNLEIMIRQR